MKGAKNMNKIVNNYFTYTNAPTLENFTRRGGCNTYLKAQQGFEKKK